MKGISGGMSSLKLSASRNEDELRVISQNINTLNFRHKETRFKRVVSFLFQWLREPELIKGECLTQ